MRINISVQNYHISITGDDGEPLVDMKANYELDVPSVADLASGFVQVVEVISEQIAGAIQPDHPLQDEGTCDHCTGGGEFHDPGCPTIVSTGTNRELCEVCGEVGDNHLPACVHYVELGGESG